MPDASCDAFCVSAARPAGDCRLQLHLWHAGAVLQSQSNAPACYDPHYTHYVYYVLSGADACRPHSSASSAGCVWVQCVYVRQARSIRRARDTWAQLWLIAIPAGLRESRLIIQYLACCTRATRSQAQTVPFDCYSRQDKPSRQPADALFMSRMSQSSAVLPLSPPRHCKHAACHTSCCTPRTASTAPAPPPSCNSLQSTMPPRQRPASCAS